MKNRNTVTVIALLLVLSSFIYADLPNNFSASNMSVPVNTVFIGGNTILTPLMSNGILNYDKVSSPSGYAGMLWPVSSTTRKTIDFASGLWLGAKVILPGNIKELRTAPCMYNSVFTAGNIPVLGQVPPQSVCDDPSWKGYLVNLVDQSLVNGGVRTKNAGGSTYTITYDSWADWPVSKGAPYVEVNGNPGYQPSWNGDRPGIGIGSVRPVEISYMVYMDYTNCTDNLHQQEISMPGGTKPMGAEVQQLVFTFSNYLFDKSVFYRWKIINKSSNAWDSTYIGLVNDADVGDAVDDHAGSDSLREMSYIYNASNNDNVYGSAPPALGIRQIQGPIVPTGNSSDTVKLPYGVYVGYRMLRLSSAIVFANINDPCFGDPDVALEGYNFMRGLDGCGNPKYNPLTNAPTKFEFSGNPCNQTGWMDNAACDRRTIQSTGPLTMNPGDTQVVVMLFMVGSGSSNLQSVCDLQIGSENLRNSYYNGLPSSVIGITPISGVVPENYALYQNYPNPFNPSTNIKFSIAGVKEQHVRLAIYNSIGQMVSTLIDNNLKPGSYETDWDASFMPSGIYFYTINAGGFVDSKKMILIK